MVSTKPFTSSTSPEMSRLLTAAVVSKSFCSLLLNNPAKAIAAGYNGEIFRLSMEERERIYSIRASSLPEFARQLIGEKRLPATRRPVRQTPQEYRVAVYAGLD